MIYAVFIIVFAFLGAGLLFAASHRRACEFLASAVLAVLAVILIALALTGCASAGSGEYYQIPIPDWATDPIIESAEEGHQG